MRGETKATLRVSENSAQARERLVMVVSTGTSSSVHCFRSHVGTGSREHDLVGDFLIMSSTKSVLTGSNCRSGVPEKSALESVGSCCGGRFSKSVLIVLILSLK